MFHHGTSGNQRDCSAVQLPLMSRKHFGTSRVTEPKAIARRHVTSTLLWTIIKHYQRISNREAFVTAEMVRNAYQGIDSEYETLLKAFDRENEMFKKRVGKNRVMARNHVAAFIKSFYRRTDMSMLEITPDFIKEFAAYLSTEAGLHNGTIWEKCMWLKGVIMRALQRTDTEKPVCPISYQSECKGA